MVLKPSDCLLREWDLALWKKSLSESDLGEYINFLHAENKLLAELVSDFGMDEMFMEVQSFAKEASP